MSDSGRVCPACGARNAPAARFCSACGTAIGDQIRQSRRPVSVLFADISGSTAMGERLDPEAVRELLARHFAAIRKTIEHHGGTVEKFIGDAVMAVFGLPDVHEDDALRAVRAAIDIREGISALNAEPGMVAQLAMRIGIASGEVVGAIGDGESLVTGDTVNTAARLEQAASPGEILINAEAHRLVLDAVEGEAVEPILAKGKAEPVSAFRVNALRGDQGRRRHLDAPLIGRETELDQLTRSWEETVAQRAPRLATVVGPAGIGKSRLVLELGDRLSERGARVIKGRCLSYGDGITYWPIRELMLTLASSPEGEPAADAADRLTALVAAEADGPILARRIASAVGLSAEPAPQEEIFWAIRRLLEARARIQPLLVVIEDLHWAEPTLLDLIEYIVDLATDVPLFIVATARAELLEMRPGWVGGRPNAWLLRLEGLPAESSRALLEALPGGDALTGELRERIEAAAEGNALFLEEMLAMLREDGYLVQDGAGWRATGDPERVQVPSTIRALLAARLDSLPGDERDAAERASVVGRRFETAALAELAPESLRPELSRTLLGLVRKELLRPDRAEVSTGDAFRFRHILIRDAAYAALPKAERADLHERFARWLAQAAAGRIAQYEEILAYHLEQAHGYLLELGRADQHAAAMADEAFRRFVTAGQHALQRSDLRAVIRLWRRAMDLPAGDMHDREALLPDLAFALCETGDIEAADELVEQAIQSLPEDATPVRRGRLELARSQVLIYTTFQIDWSDLRDRLLPMFKAAGDHAAIARALLLSSAGAFWQGSMATAVTTLDRARLEADLAGAPYLGRMPQYAGALAYGSEPIGDVLRTLQARLSMRPDPMDEWIDRHEMTVVQAMLGNIAQARGEYRRCIQIADDLGMLVARLGSAEALAEAELIAGDATFAEAELQESIDGHIRIGGHLWLGNMLAYLAIVQARLGRPVEALETADRAAASTNDPTDPVDWSDWCLIHRARGLAFATQGRIDEALPEVDAALDLLDGRDMLPRRADISFERARILHLLGRDSEARDSLTVSRDLATRKGYVVAVRRANLELARWDSGGQ